MEIEPGALPLRFRDHAVPLDAATPDLAAFLRAPAEDAPTDDALGVLPGRGPADPDGPLVVFFQQPDFGIPAPGYDHRLPDLAAWNIRTETSGWIATVPPPTRAPGPRRAVQVLAGCLALALPTHADAAPAPTPVVQKPTASATTAEPARKPAPATATAATPPALPPEPEPQPVAVEPAPAPAVTPPPVVTPPPPVAPVRDPVADAAWAGVVGIDVVLGLKGGKVLRGRVGAVQLDTFTLINRADGQILVIPKSSVTSLRAYIPPPLPTKNGTGLIAGGSVLTALGVPVFITGVTFLAICPSCTYLHLPMLIVGGGALGAGIPMISRGIQRRTAFQRAVQEHQLSPMVTRTPYGGWSGGLQLRF